MFLAQPCTATGCELEEAYSSLVKVKNFPILSSGKITVEFKDDKEFRPGKIFIINQLGYIVYKIPIINNKIKYNLNLTSLPSVVYILRLLNSKQFTPPIKFIVQH